MALDAEALAKLAALQDEDFSESGEGGSGRTTSHSEELRTQVRQALAGEVGHVVEEDDTLESLGLTDLQLWAVVARVEDEGYVAMDKDVDSAKSVADLIGAFASTQK